MTTIEPVRPADWTTALELALARTPDEHRAGRVRQCIRLLETGVIDARGVWVARQKQTVVGVQVCVALAGSTCLFWLPGANESDADALVQAALAWCRSNNCKIAQALVFEDDLPLAFPLLRQGFRHVTRMHLLRHDLVDFPAEPSYLRYEAYRPALAGAFAATLERTYEGTLDCPELNGKRTIEEIIAGHRGQGKYHPECWWLAFENADPIGLLLLAEMPDSLSWELMYLGVVPDARRRGHGRTMTLKALHWLRDQPATLLTLTVDDRNRAARRLYEALGFVETECSEVLLYFF